MMALTRHDAAPFIPTTEGGLSVLLMIDAVSVLLIENDSQGETKAGKALASMPNVILSKASTWSMAIRMMTNRMKAEVLVVDLNLPDVLDAYETANKISGLAKTFPIVVFSDVAEVEIRQQCMKAGVIAFHKKSDTSPEDLRQSVTKAIHQTQRRKIDSEIETLSAIVPDRRANGV